MHPALAAILARPIAHRGLHDRSAGRVENSMEAAEAAAAAGYAIECDVQPSAEGEAIVFHDDALDRLTSASGRVDARGAASLATLSLRGGGTIPTLARLMDRVAGRVPLVVEIKGGSGTAGPLAARVCALAAAYGGPVALKSFDASTVLLCRRSGISCPVGLVGPGKDGGDDPPAAADVLASVDFLSWHVGALASLRQRDPALPLMSWTIRSHEQAAQARGFAAQIVFEDLRP